MFGKVCMFQRALTLMRPVRLLLQPSVSSSIYRRPRNIPVSDNHDSLLKSRLAENRPLLTTEWAELRSELIATDTLINEVNVDATILSRCLPEAQLEVGKSYVKFLRDQGIKPNLATVGKLFRLYHASEKALTDEDKAEIVKL